jgi:hypothetical protein
MVVTDDRGRYVVPDLPPAKYKVWVRGYGLIDSPKVDAEPGKQLNLAAVSAPNDAAAAQYYPAIYWYSMMKVPDASQFGPKGIPVKQAEYINLMKNNGCVGCHQLGTQATRTIPAVFGADSSCRPRRSAIWRIGPTASPRASCRMRRRSGRRGSSVTSWSRPTTGRTRSTTCTT